MLPISKLSFFATVRGEAATFGVLFITLAGFVGDGVF